jgi:hypothetical protein
MKAVKALRNAVNDTEPKRCRAGSKESPMKRSMYTAALLGIAALASAARADGVRVEVERAGKSWTVYDNPRLLDDLAKVWNDQREPLDRRIENELTKLNPKLPKGVNFARQHSILAPARISGSVRHQLTAPEMVLVFEAKGNRLDTRFTQPTVVGVEGDPAFMVTYDVRVTIAVPVGQPVRTLQASQATVEVSNVKIEPRNTVAKIMQGLNQVQAFFTGKDYKAMAEKMLTVNVDFKRELNGRLAPLNKELAKLAPMAGPTAKVVVQYRNGFILHVIETPSPRAAQKAK